MHCRLGVVSQACLRLVLLVACAACATAPPPPAGRATPTAAVAPLTSPVRPAPHDVRDVDVLVELRAPLRAHYEQSLGEATKPSLGVVVTNRSRGPLDVSDLRVHLEAVRESVAFRCSKDVGKPLGDREPSVLRPGASFVFERVLDCALPLVGAYAVRVSVAFGSGDFRRPREVRAFALTVAALPAVAPREIDGLPGLWAAMGSSGILAGGEGRGTGRTLVTIVNASRKPIEVPRMRLALRVYRPGSSIPCEDEPLVLGTPQVLGSGETYHEPVLVSCLGLGTAGSYDVAARLVVPGGSEGDRELALGKLHIDVVTDPSLVIPPPWRRAR